MSPSNLEAILIAYYKYDKEVVDDLYLSKELAEFCNAQKKRSKNELSKSRERTTLPKGNPRRALIHLIQRRGKPTIIDHIYDEKGETKVKWRG